MKNFISRIGNRKSSISLLFVHGGPGMDESYFRPFLEPLGNQYEIIFYRQLRVPFKTDDGLNELLRQLDDIVNSLNNSSIFLFGHSWGTVLALSLIHI